MIWRFAIWQTPQRLVMLRTLMVGFCPPSTPGKGRVDLVAHGREVGQGGRLVGQFLLPLFAGSLPGLCGPYPLRLGDDVGVSRFQRRAQGGC